jgi:hypothetical protein
VYDYLLTFSDEVNWVWRKSVTPVSILFYITRYLPFFDTIALFFCTRPFLDGVSSADALSQLP